SGREAKDWVARTDREGWKLEPPAPRSPFHLPSHVPPAVAMNPPTMTEGRPVGRFACCLLAALLLPSSLFAGELGPRAQRRGRRRPARVRGGGRHQPVLGAVRALQRQLREPRLLPRRPLRLPRPEGLPAPRRRPPQPA